MHQPIQQLRLLDSVHVAAMLGITPGTLKFWRHKNRGPKFVKLGDSPQAGVAYDEADVRAFIESRKFASTSAYSPAGLANVRPTISRTPELTR
ncbi:DNA-binding protein [Sphingomonas sp. BN140010]|uniref:DNA-binding protein n=1 Tax=Sphingomonas arvum TaxID=2992113 RepID=A0ABT3JEA6_9SPHN|nr:DNA-binding protein [Sphingomonas sp. BN140010]MCW3797371.1 DNA-binding protein [Sphingomonas sp. BN140010]